MQNKLEKILKDVADAEGITNYEIYPNIDTIRGDGFLSECYTGDVLNKDTGSKIQIFVKVEPPKLTEAQSPVYSNEFLFYSRIFPELNKFQKEKGVKDPFSNIPKFYCGNGTKDKFIAMENLLTQNYALSNKSENMDPRNIKAVFKKYGQFHALTFAYKEQNSEKYLEIIEPLRDIFASFKEGIAFFLPAAYKALKDSNAAVAKKVEPLSEKLEEVYNNVVTYKGKYSAFTHGDCWSNNMLFKYGESEQIEDIRLLDFQLCRDSTPIHDLSYFFYSAASKEEFKKIDEYLELYHKSFSAFAKELGSNSEKLLPLDTLKSEWKIYGLFGILLGVMLWAPKLMNKEKIGEFSKGEGDDDQRSQSFRVSFEEIMESDEFKKNTSDILIHAVEYGII